MPVQALERRLPHLELGPCPRAALVRPQPRRLMHRPRSHVVVVTLEVELLRLVVLGVVVPVVPLVHPMPPMERRHMLRMRPIAVLA